MRWRSSKPREDDEQRVLFAWLALQRFAGEPLTEYYFHIPNGGKRDPKAAAILKMLGVKAGACDIFGMIPRQDCHGHFIELKPSPPQRARVTPEQKRFMANADAMGYRVDLCRGFEAAQLAVCAYLSLARPS